MGYFVVVVVIVMLFCCLSFLFCFVVSGVFSYVVEKNQIL